jgi:hypothetical protein
MTMLHRLWTLTCRADDLLSSGSERRFDLISFLAEVVALSCTLGVLLVATEVLL